MKFIIRHSVYAEAYLVIPEPQCKTVLLNMYKNDRLDQPARSLSLTICHCLWITVDPMLIHVDSHYENTPVQYYGIFYGCKNEK